LPGHGEIAWHFQFSPGDPYDYDGTNELVLGEVAMGGKPTRVLMQANRNGYFYVLDRSSGKLLSAAPFARKINWASGIDMATGRPIDTAMTATVRKTEQMTDFIEVWPSAFGGKNWPSFDPQRRVAYFNTVNLGRRSVRQPAKAGAADVTSGSSWAASSHRRMACAARWSPGIRPRARSCGRRPARRPTGPAWCPRPAAWSSPARRPASSWPSTPRRARSCGSSRPAPDHRAADRLGAVLIRPVTKAAPRRVWRARG
jgi:hypothetical protein